MAVYNMLQELRYSQQVEQILDDDGITYYQLFDEPDL